MTEKLSELYRIAAKEYVELESAANALEQTKSANFSQMVVALGEGPITRLEHQARASSQWLQFLHHMIRARKDANLKEVEVEWIRMRHKEQLSEEFNARAERHL